MKLSLRGSIRRQIAAACAIVVVAVSTSPAFAAQRAKFQVENRVPAAVQSGSAKLVSHADPNQQYELAIALPAHDQAGLDSLLKSLYDRTSPNYHHYLSVQQFADRFAPSPADYAKVVKFAHDNGFNVTVQHANRLAVSFTGTTEQIEHAFHVTMNNYQHPTENRTFYAPDREPTIEGLDVPVLLIAGLDNYVLPHSRLKNLGQLHGATLKPEAKIISNVRPDATTPPVSCYGSPYSVDVGSGPCNTYTPANMRTAYYGGTTYTGSGQQIGIVGFGGYYPADLTGFATVENMSVPTVVFSLGSACSASCSDGEQMLDILWSYGMAPGITEINFFSNSSNDLTIINAMASSTVDAIYSSSWGWASKNYTAEDTDYKEMSAQGQTYLNATGDDGGYNDDTWDFPSGDPYITQVGGTQVITNGIGGSWDGENAWPDSSGGVPPATDTSGGYNYGVTYAIPSWQVPAVNSSNGISSTNRSDPDISAEADYEMLGCTGSKRNGESCEDTYGGTSYATPTWAGFLAMVNQASVAAGNGTIGFPNYDLYALGASTLYSANLHDVTVCGGIDAGEGPGPDCNSSDEGTPVQGYNPVAGFDDVTGWGSPSAALIATLSVPVYSISPTSGTTATSFGNTISYPDASGAVTFYAKVGTSGTPVSVGTCTLTNSTCSASFTGSTLGVGSYNGYAVYTEVETYGSTTRTVNKTSNLMAFTIADNVSVSASTSPNSITTAQSSTVTVTVADSSNSAITLTGSVSFAAGSTNLGSCTLSAGTCSIMVAGSTLGVGSYSIVPTYTPTAGYTVTSVTDASLTVGSPSVGAISFTSVSHNFGQVAVGTPATYYGLTITNTSTTTAYPFSLNFTAANGFTEANNCTASIAAGAKCQLDFYFTPTKTGAVSATWSLAAESGFSYTPSNGGTLQGSGTSQGGVSLTTNGHNFGTVAVGQTSATYGTELSNSTTSVETLTLGPVPSGPFHMVTNCGTTLPAGSSCEIEFTYQPTTTSPVSVVVPLSGTPTAITSGGAALPSGGITLSGN